MLHIYTRLVYTIHIHTNTTNIIHNIHTILHTRFVDILLRQPKISQSNMTLKIH